MALGFPDPWKALAKRKRHGGPRTVNAFLGFFLFLNLCVGTGFLGVPYAFFYSGYVVAIPTLLLVAFVCWTAANWEIETMARAQAVETFEKERRQLVKRNGDVTSADAGAVGIVRGITIGDEGEELRYGVVWGN